MAMLPLLCRGRRAAVTLMSVASATAAAAVTAPVAASGCMLRRHMVTLGPPGEQVEMRRALVLRKSSQYEVEKMRFGSDNEAALHSALNQRGTNAAALHQHYLTHTGNLEYLTTALKARGVKVHLVHTHEFKPADLQGIDVVFSVGGDGTFLSAASKVMDGLPVVGFNSDPTKSKGELCLSSADTSCPRISLQRFLDNEFAWMRRTRIRVVLSDGDNNQTVLPVRALNDVFIAEAHPYRTSYYDLIINDGQQEFHKSSGLIVATGTGSTAWSYNDAKIYHSHIETILKLANYPAENLTPDLIRRVTDEYNKTLIFSPTDMKMFFVVRAPIFNETTNIINTLGMSQKITVRSRSWDAHLSIDGLYVTPFNDGRAARLSIHPEDALRTPRLHAEDMHTD